MMTMGGYSIFSFGAVHKVRHAIFSYFYPPPSVTLRHTSRDPPRKYVTHLGPPGFLEGLVQKTRTKAPLYKFCINCSRGFYSEGLSEGLLSGRFCPRWFLFVPVLPEYISYNRKLNIALNLMFRMYDKNLLSMTSHALYPLPLSQTVPPSQPPPLEPDVLYGRPLYRHFVYRHFVYYCIPAYRTVIHPTSVSAYHYFHQFQLLLTLGFLFINPISTDTTITQHI